MKTNSKIYIAGHKGLVGSAITKSLTAKAYKNIIGRDINELDLRDPNAVSTFFETEKPEYVFLAAAKVGGIVANNTYRAEFIYDNLMIQNNVIHQASLHGVKKLLFLGSTCIYPRDCPQPMKEEYLLSGPLEYTNEPYAIAKIAGIRMCESYNIQYGTNFLSVMPTNLYGPNDNFDLEKSHVLPALIRKMHLGKCLEAEDWPALMNDFNKRPVNNINGTSSRNEIVSVLQKHGIIQIPQSGVQVEIWGSGNPMREFLWSEDMADACVFVMENVNVSDLDKILQSETMDESLAKEIRNQFLNIGTGTEISIKDLAHLVKEIAGFRGEIFFNRSKPDGTMRKLTDPGKLNSLGWKHNIEIYDGIRKLYQWYQEN